MVVRLLGLTAAIERGGGGGKLEVLLCAREVLVWQMLVMKPPLAACIGLLPPKASGGCWHDRVFLPREESMASFKNERMESLVLAKSVRRVGHTPQHYLLVRFCGICSPQCLDSTGMMIGFLFVHIGRQR
ncbi:unnamed protein product [Ectocarpus sp. 13 AM-2016]